jgi:hypothetical protein
MVNFQYIVNYPLPPDGPPGFHALKLMLLRQYLFPAESLAMGYAF